MKPKLIEHICASIVGASLELVPVERTHRERCFASTPTAAPLDPPRPEERYHKTIFIHGACHDFPKEFREGKLHYREVHVGDMEDAETYFRIQMVSANVPSPLCFDADSLWKILSIPDGVTTINFDTLLQANVPRNIVLSVDGSRLSVSTAYAVRPVHVLARLEREAVFHILAPTILVPRQVDPHREAIEELEALLGSPHIKEDALQDFFERFPNFIRMGQYDKIVAQPVLERDGEGSLKPDFVLQPVGDMLWDIADIKLPLRNVVVTKKNRYHFCAQVTELVGQLMTYREYFESAEYRRRIQAKYGFLAFRPKLIGVIGRDIRLGPLERRKLEEQLPPHVKILTYADVLRKAKAQTRRT